ncbi:MAG: hypothetical protein HY921_04400 [Elusimicrobia bacterium]|nr:hypothetical protein [Elusimicrobiota bacterium]
MKWIFPIFILAASAHAKDYPDPRTVHDWPASEAREAFAKAGPVTRDMIFGPADGVGEWELEAETKTDGTGVREEIDAWAQTFEFYHKKDPYTKREFDFVVRKHVFLLPPPASQYTQESECRSAFLLKVGALVMDDSNFAGHEYSRHIPITNFNRRSLSHHFLCRKGADAKHILCRVTLKQWSKPILASGSWRPEGEPSVFYQGYRRKYSGPGKARLRQ